jgi:hypothetical protein
VIGDVITFTIPKELQYSYPKKDKNNAAVPTPKSTEYVDQMESLDTSEFEPIKTIKMEIVESEPTGNTYLRGEKQFVGIDGQPRNLLLLSKIPTRNLNQFEMSVEALNQIAITDVRHTGLVNYSSPGWDLTTSRIMSGYVPDIQAELTDVYNRKKELNEERKALQELQKSLKSEKDRLIQERERMANLERARNEESNSGDNIAKPQSQNETPEVQKNNNLGTP